MELILTQTGKNKIKDYINNLKEKAESTDKDAISLLNDINRFELSEENWNITHILSDHYPLWLKEREDYYNMIKLPRFVYEYVNYRKRIMKKHTNNHIYHTFVNDIDNVVHNTERGFITIDECMERLATL